MLKNRRNTAVKRSDRLDVLRHLMEQLSRHEGASVHCWISEVCAFGAILDNRITELPFVEVRVTVTVAMAAGSSLAMWSIVKKLQRTDKFLKISLLLDLL